MNPTAKIAFEAYETVLGGDPVFKSRPGQRDMARQVAKTFASGTLGESEAPTRSIAVIQAGTGVGKSLAASVPAIAAAIQRKTRVIISTATITLQQQLVEKDLPRFSALMDKPFTFMLAKGRSNYVCKVKLERSTSGKGGDLHGLFDDEPEQDPSKDPGPPTAASESAIVLHRELARDLASGKWDGEKDTVGIAGAGLKWETVAADRHTCTGRRCPMFSGCTYYEARKRLADVDVIVANHALLLASLGTKVLPDLSDTLLIVDEGHALAEVASGQFTAEMDLTNLRWLDQLAQRVQKVGTAIRYDSTAEAIELTRSVKRALNELQAIGMGLFPVDRPAGQDTVRFEHGAIPDYLEQPLLNVQATANALAKHMTGLADTLNTLLKESPGDAARLTTMYSALGAFAPRLDGALQAATLLLEHAEEPNAKWLSFSDETGYVTVKAHASPLNPGKHLAKVFWSQVRSAVITSATLTSCGSFDFLLNEIGLRDDPDVTTLSVESPFDFKRQGRLVVVRTKSSARDIAEYNREVIGEFLVDAADVKSGALALFTSKKHMQQTHESMPESLAARVLVQGSMSRSALIREHKRRVDAGEPSLILGLQSFGQGVDLAGAYCETLMLAKLPFQPPTDAIGQARAEWLTTQGRDSFNELSVPATGVKLNQWVGRLIRTEEDTGTVICYDKRLVDTGYGRRLLSGMPPFQVIMRANGEESPRG